MQSNAKMITATQDIAIHVREHFGTVGTVIQAQGAHCMYKNPFSDAELARRVDALRSEVEARDPDLFVL